MADPPAEEPEEKADGPAASASRENFLRRLERQQQQRVKSPPEEEKASVDEPASESEDPEGPKLPLGEQLLVNYLSKYCGPSSGAPSPSDWIRDVDPSSLAFLKGMAGIDDGAAANNNNGNNLPSSANNSIGDNTLTAMARLKSDSTAGSRSGSDPLRSDSNLSSTSNNYIKDGELLQGDEETRMWEVTVPPGAVPGKAFELVADGVKVRVVCPKNAGEGKRVRFYLPLSLFDNPPAPAAEEKEKAPPPPASTGGEAKAAAKAEGVGNDLSVEHKEWMKDNSFQVPGDAKPAAADENREWIPRGGTKPAAAGKLDGEDKEPAAKTDGQNDKPKSNADEPSDEVSVQRQMLSMIQNQQNQMAEMQARLDALGGMMAQMARDMNHMRYNQPPNIPPRRVGPGGAPAGGYSILGGFWGGNRQRGQRTPGVVVQQPPPGMPPFAPGMPPPAFGPPGGVPGAIPPGFGPGGMPPQAPPGAAMPGDRNPPPPETTNVPQATAVGPRDERDHVQILQNQQQQPGAPPPPQPRQQQPGPPVAVPAPPGAAGPPPRHEQVVLVNQGIFFPLFVALFRLLLSLPGRLRDLLLHTGPGRVYAHLRRRAIERNAFANVDLSSIMKLLVMLLIFTGRVGEGENRRNRRNARAREEDVDGFVAYAYSIARSLYDYWNGHRAHALVLASLIGFLVQVGLMGFLHEVLWVERAELGRAWLGLNEQEDEDAEADDVNSEAAVNGEEREEARRRARQAQPPAGGIIRRGPENGGFFHDVQCLIASFLLSLIPAWRPEEAAEPLPEPEARQAPREDQEGAPEGGQGQQQEAAPGSEPEQQGDQTGAGEAGEGADAGAD